jgi:hypothetical protein
MVCRAQRSGESFICPATCYKELSQWSSSWPIKWWTLWKG